ncbi:Asp23/Gls24 family envelope stress response protein [Tepidibacillus marianensis]|uniref:Asp23/Gls24 family envelope stress response protein n=1 Tax=Tepidibacillus marianensis TaxID=3131995 RepID=UPI0030D466FB
MAIEVTTDLGKVFISDEVVATVAGISAMEVFGLVGMASRKQLKDGISELLGRENLGRGIEVRTEDDEVVIDMYIIVSYGTKISEVAHNVQQKVIYTLDTMMGIRVSRVNVIVQGVRVTQA